MDADLNELHLQLKHATREIAALKEEGLLLREALGDVGLICEEAFQARLHRRRFNSMKHSSDWSSNAHFEDVLASLEVTSLIAALCSPQEVLIGCLASKSIACSAKQLESILLPQLCCIESTGGLNRDLAVSCFSLVLDKWEYMASEKELGICCSSAVMGNKVYIIGGFDLGDVKLCEGKRFDPIGRCWEDLPSMSQDRYEHTSSAISGKLYVIGGKSEPFPGRVLDSAESFDPVAWVWEHLPSLAEGRTSHSATVVDGLLHVIGGECMSGNLHSSAECFDPIAGVWVGLPSMSEGRSGHMASIIDGKIYVVGGCRNNSFECFNPVLCSWEILPPLPGELRHNVSSSVIAGRLYIFGGAQENCAAEEGTCFAARFDAMTGIWEDLPPMSEARFSHSSCAMAGKLYVVGGVNKKPGHLNRLSSVERFDPVALTWETLPPVGSECVRPLLCTYMSIS